jgi:hypothetical protein
MGALIGFILGYSLGVKAGPEGYERLRQAWQEISNSEEFKGLVATGTAFLENMLAQGQANLAGQIAEMSGSNGGGLQQAIQKMSGNGDLLDAWNRISSSDQFRNLVANGMAIVGGVLEQGATVLSDTLKEGRRPEQRA